MPGPSEGPRGAARRAAELGRFERERASWQGQLGQALRDSEQLVSSWELSATERLGIERAASAGLPLRVTPHLVGLGRPDDPRCPIRQQFVPQAAEGSVAPGDRADPLGEEEHEVAPRLVRRYPDRALLLVTDQCAAHCRFCTRGRWVAAGQHPPSLRALEPALAYLRAHPEVQEVILSGGDPLTLATAKLERIVRAVRAIEHVGVIRLATRVPSCLPSRVTPRLVQALAAHHPLWVMTHFNHPAELGEQARAACERFVDGGFPVMNQTVLLRGINDDAAVLAALFRGLVAWRVRPYYLMQADPAAGTAHLRTPLDAGPALLAALQGRLSGIALPKLVVDTPGGAGKVPLGVDYVVRRTAAGTVLETPRGTTAVYVDPPASS